jgi:hypothetical protein
MDENWGYPYDLGNLHLPRNITQLSFFCLTQRITTKDAWLVFREKTGRENPIYFTGSMLFSGNGRQCAKFVFPVDVVFVYPIVK